METSFPLRPNLVAAKRNRDIVLRDSAPAGSHGQHANLPASAENLRDTIEDQFPELEKEYDGHALEELKGSADHYNGNDIGAIPSSWREHIRFLNEVPPTMNISEVASQSPEEKNSPVDSVNPYEVRTTTVMLPEKTGNNGKSGEDVLADYANHLDKVNNDVDNVMLHEFQNYPVEDILPTNVETSFAAPYEVAGTLKPVEIEDVAGTPASQRSPTESKSTAAADVIVVQSPQTTTTMGVEIPSLERVPVADVVKTSSAEANSTKTDAQTPV
ncbi:hypothetical protein OSTOST_04895 [Ostertagia ostertagi]